MTMQARVEMGAESPMAHAAARAVEGQAWEQRFRDMEEHIARLEDELRRGLDEAFCLAASASLDSKRTQVRTGTREEEWCEHGH